MGGYLLEDFIRNTGKKAPGQGVFELEKEHLLGVNLRGVIWTKMGSMVAYTGNIRFTREGTLEHGLGKMVKISMGGEEVNLIKTEGVGKLYLADKGKRISVLKLERDSIYVNFNDILAIEDSISWDIRMMKKFLGVTENEIYNIKLEGTGIVAITTHHEPLTFRVTRERPIFTDPNTTVAWTGNLEPEVKSELSLKTSIGRSTGESVQMIFRGEGFVVVQPYEEINSQTQTRKGVSTVNVYT
ncbi:AIM24 family protein [Methanosarcina hadiensis]|uniref:AIM24 family protein n=1 Tax=Methanosarcina hadiensis TaxID=3078083 RepID=UPI00397783A0